ncbi:LacI family DNA-binding transcriptional regulator [Sinomonas sp. ASV486]|uniref:LacI family DNA-binding transcriptional regulator n=1 Tax=Sinomonas sp. ASV486 TaxID=3051170 RepID=UPI0027DB35ED|nr:LacI family DNA-binding transcriptional regulator [Sinomonas sp. ASV486]MDQ4490139.1 LacI family DNA-binding transcriptional regulator [Sinomonas sp. ASV486]
MPKPQATIYDIAALVGVNASTVSRALSRPGRVSAATQRRIEDAARELDYHVNTVARAVKTGRLQTIGLLVPDIAYAVYQDILRGAERAAREVDYVVLVGEEFRSAQAELDWARRVRAAVDGVILASPRIPDARIREFAGDKPTVVVNRVLNGVPSVVPDVAPGVRAAVVRAAELGHRRLLYIPGVGSSWMSRSRWDILEAAGAEAGIEAVSAPPGMPSRRRGAELADDVLASGCSLVIAFNDLIAIGLLQELQDRGVPVPERLSIVGFDNIRGSDFTSPRLATIGAPLNEAGGQAVRMLLARIEGSTDRGTAADDGGPGAPSYGLATVFHERGSLGPA